MKSDARKDMRRRPTAGYAVRKLSDRWMVALKTADPGGKSFTFLTADADDSPDEECEAAPMIPTATVRRSDTGSILFTPLESGWTDKAMANMTKLKTFVNEHKEDLTGTQLSSIIIEAIKELNGDAIPSAE